MELSRLNILGWTLMGIGLVVWFYGYVATGHPPLVDWSSTFPEWISEFLPNLESEIGFAMMILGAVPAYWPRG